MTQPWLDERPDGIRIRIHAQPGAKRSQVMGLHGDSLKIQIQAPPVEGKANKELIAFLAKALECPKSALAIVSGELGRAKSVQITGLSASEVAARLCG